MKNYREVKIGPYSAYAIAKKNGFEGTEEEWLESLKPPAVDKTLTEEGQAADAKVTGDALATKAVIDDAAVGTDAWSSKHIIDTICPPLDETGNPVVCYPVASYPLGVKASWEPTQEGSGTPSPENIRPIKGRDSVTVTRCGENLFNPAWMLEKTLSNGLTWTITSDGTVTANGTANGTSYYNSDYFSLPAGTYTISAMPHFRISILNMDVDDAPTIAAQNIGQPYTFTVENDIQKAKLFFVASGTLDNVSAKPQIEKGTTAPTTYAPYTGQTATLSLPRTIYGGTVDAVTGEGVETWEKPFDFSEYEGENRIAKGQPDGGWAQADNAVPWFVYDDVISSTSVVCDKLKAIASITSKTTPYTIGIGYKWIAIRGPWPTAEEVRTWLRQQKPMVSYQLATPTPFTATGAHPIPALPGVNTLLTNADSVTVTGRADPIKRITDLEDAVASMT